MPHICQECIFYIPNPTPESSNGWCRYDPPVIDISDPDGWAKFPRCDGGWWCGAGIHTGDDAHPFSPRFPVYTRSR